MKKILLIQLASMGDCLFVTTIARQIKEVDHVGCHLTWLIGDKYSQVLDNNPYIDEVLVAPIPSPEGGRLMLPNIMRDFVNVKNRFDLIVTTEYIPDNLHHFYGSTRSGFFRAYGKPITVSREPLLFLSEAEKRDVVEFANAHNLGAKKAQTLLFECTPMAGQSPMNLDRALAISEELISRNLNLQIVLSTKERIEHSSSRLIDGSVISWRQNAELTRYCDLLVGCSSGISWLNTSNAAAKIPMVQNLCAERDYFNGIVSPSMELDFFMNDIPTDSLIEFINADNNGMVECIDLILKNSFSDAKAKYPGRPKIGVETIEQYFSAARSHKASMHNVAASICKKNGESGTNYKTQREAMIRTQNSEQNHLIFTIVARNYVAQAAVLGKSLAENASNVRFIPVICDTYRSEENLLFATRPDLQKSFNWMYLDDFNYQNYRAMALRYDPTEFCTSVKPALFMQLIEENPNMLVSYFDPDIIVYGPLSELESSMEKASFTLIPHILSDPYDLGAVTAPGIMSAGIYNLGFCGINPVFDETLRILRWWRDKLEFECISKQPLLFVDQKWMDFIPAFAEHFRIFRHPGYNTAYWNLHERFFSEEGGVICVNKQPLKFYHFSGYSPDNPDRISKYQTTITLDGLPLLERLLRDYSKRLLSNGYQEFSNLEYANNYSLKTRERIPPVLRAQYLNMGKNIGHLAFDPFEDPWIQGQLESGTTPKNLYPTLDPPLFRRRTGRVIFSPNGKFSDLDVRVCYRELLGREPECHAVIEHHLRTAESRAGLEAAIKASKEYRDLHGIS